MNCRDASDFLMDYVDGELPQPVSATFEAHLASCPNCCEFLVQYRATIHAERTACAQGDAAAASLPEDLIKAILASLASGK